MDKREVEKLASENALKNRLLETIFERVEDYAIFSLDANGIITSWAIGAEKMKLYTREEVIGKNFSMLYPEEGILRNEPEAHLITAKEEGRFRGEGLRKKKNGVLFLADVFITPMYEDGVLVGFFKIVTDLTERNRVIQERDLSRTKAETLEIESDLRNRFISMLTHDLRNPLSAARMSAEMITSRHCDFPKHHDYAQRSIDHIDRVDKMISDLLDVSRIRKGEPFPLIINECDFIKIVHEIVEELTILHGERFEISSPESLTGFWDSRGMRRILENLLSNAIKYGDQEARVKITVENLHSRIIIKVHNHGSPISSADQDSLFELFHRTESAKKSSKKGWGLGLTLVKGITEAHGGIVKLRSLPKEGTTFILDFPIDARKLKEAS